MFASVACSRFSTQVLLIANQQPHCRHSSFVMTPNYTCVQVYDVFQTVAVADLPDRTLTAADLAPPNAKV